MKRIALVMLALVFLVSVAINIRSYFIYEEMDQGYWELFFKDNQKNDVVYYLLEQNRIEEAKEFLSESIQNRSMLYFMMHENGQISDELVETLADAKLSYQDRFNK